MQKQSSAQLCQVHRALIWNSKTQPLATAHGVKNLLGVEKPTSLCREFCMGLLVGVVCATCVLVILYLFKVKNIGVFVALGLISFFSGFCLTFGLRYRKQTTKLARALQDLSDAFKTDVDNLSSLPIEFSRFSGAQKTVLLVRGMSVLRHFLLRRYACRDFAVGKSVQELHKTYMRLSLLLSLNLVERIRETKALLATRQQMTTARLLEVDLVFRLYLPLYALLQQARKEQNLAEELSSLILDDEVAFCIQQLTP